MITEKKQSSFYRQALALQNKFEAAHRKQISARKQAAQEKRKDRERKSTTSLTYTQQFVVCVLVIEGSFKCDYPKCWII